MMDPVTDRLSAIEGSMQALIEQMNDHDLLIRVSTMLESLTREVREQGRASSDDRRMKADVTDLDELIQVVKAHGDQIESVKKFVWMGLGAIAALQVAIQIIITK
jgi:cob(I)alamin adenosyltransferase